MEAIIGKIDTFIRPSYKDNKFILQKARLLVATHIITFIYALVHLIIFLFIGFNAAACALSILIITTLTGLFLFKKTISINVATNSIIFFAFLSFITIIVSTGGIFSPTLSWLLPVSLIGFLLANRTIGLFWSTISIFTILTFFVLNKNDVRFPIILQNQYISLHNVIAYFGSSVFVLLVVLIYDTISRNRTRELELINEKLTESEASLLESMQALENKDFDLQVMNSELLEKTEELMQQTEEIITQKKEIESQRDEIFEQKKEIERKNQNLTDSIIYAKRIQQAMLPNKDLIATNCPEHFILFKPRDIVSGDFYWFKQIKNFTYIAAADCTGHGVPGAFMSMLGISILNEIVTKRDLNPPNEVLDELRKRVKKSLHQTGQDGEAQDGMDIALCLIDKESNEIQFSGAFNPLYIYRKNAHNSYDLIESKADRMPIGIHPHDNRPFTNRRLNLQKNDTLYIFSDGYTSQFGGQKSEKFKSVRLKEILLDIQDKDMQTQQQILEDTITQWMGKSEQVDDILLIGVRIS
ncbi:MAG TPA: SpoIIE family protein phosphatase [Bacteroidales bacterium]|nr:SpoIIE family protein phosphatase [Bacteroidales bacterium]